MTEVETAEAGFRWLRILGANIAHKVPDGANRADCGTRSAQWVPQFGHRRCRLCEDPSIRIVALPTEQHPELAEVAKGATGDQREALEAIGRAGRKGVRLHLDAETAVWLDRYRLARIEMRHIHLTQRGLHVLSLITKGK